MPLQAPRKREREYEELRVKVAGARGKASWVNVPPAQLAEAFRALADAVEELRALVERGGGR